MRSRLIADLAIPIELFHYERLRWIEQEDLTEVRTKLQQEQPKLKASFLEDGFEYLRRFYAMFVLDPLNYHALPKSLDPFYHTHLLFARDFAFFSERVFRQVMRHQPLPASDPHMGKFVRDLYQYGHGIQHKVFQQVDAAWWPAPEAEDPFCYCGPVEDRIMREHALLPKHVHRLAVGKLRN